MHVGVCPDLMDVVLVPEPHPPDHTYGNDDHALALWPAPYPNDNSGLTVGEKALKWFEEYLK